MWAVVDTNPNGGVISVDGPYRTREDARSVKRALDLEWRDTPKAHQAYVVEMTRLVTTGELRALMEHRSPY